MPSIKKSSKEWVISRAGSEVIKVKFMKYPSTKQEEYNLFTHMSELIASLPEIEKLNEKFLKASAARDVLACATEVEAAQCALDAASGQARDAVETENTSGQYIFGNSESYCLGVLTDRKHRLAVALKAHGYTDTVAASADAMPENTFSELKDRLTRFRLDYEETLAECLKSQNEE